MRFSFGLAAALAALFASVFSRTGGAAPNTPIASTTERASFALIIGVNKSVDAEAPVLRYADDDAARYLDFFRYLGARSYVLTRLDENTRRVHPQVAAEAEPPVLSEYNRAISALASDIRQARQRNVKTVVYFVYAGHGNVHDGHGYITLEDARIDGAQLESEVLQKINADQTHFIVDACYSYFLALGRGPGGRRHEVHGFSEFGGLTARESVGLLFSTSSAKESHEWAGFQAGVFSHEVRSGLYGAADANGDGQVSYREIAAFIDRANASIPNEKFRSEVFARPPKDSDVLMDLRPRMGTRLDFGGASGDHYYLEDSRGVRFADLHNDGNARVYLLRPLAAGRLYLRRARDDSEFIVPSSPQIAALADLQLQEPRARARGAANDAFDALFALPFGQSVVDGFRLEPLVPPERRSSEGDGATGRTVVGAGLLSVAALGAGAAVYGFESARSLRDDVPTGASQRDVASANEKIRARNLASAIGLGAAGFAAAGGLLLLVLPGKNGDGAVGASAGPGSVALHGRF